MRRPDPRVARQIEIGLFVPRVTHRPVPDPRWSLTVSRKAKKGVPGSSRREGPPSPQATRFGALGVGIRVASVTSWWLQGVLWPRRRQPLSRKMSQGFFQLPWHPEMEGQGRSSELGLLLKVLPGMGEKKGVLWPRRGQRGRRAAGETEGGDRLLGPQCGARGPSRRGQESGTGETGTTLPESHAGPLKGAHYTQLLRPSSARNLRYDLHQPPEPHIFFSKS